MQLIFEAFNLAPGDTLRIVDQDVSLHYSQTFTGTALPYIPRLSSSIVLTFDTNADGQTASGFRVSWTTDYIVAPTPPASIMAGDVYTVNLTGAVTQGFVRSPNFPNLYPNNANINWIVLVSTGQKIAFDIAGFVTENNKDVLQVYDGADVATQALVRIFSGDLNAQMPSRLVSDTNRLHIKFTSDSTTQYKGFSARCAVYTTDLGLFTISPPPLGSNNNQNSGASTTSPPANDMTSTVLIAFFVPVIVLLAVGAAVTYLVWYKPRKLRRLREEAERQYAAAGRPESANNGTARPRTARPGTANANAKPRPGTATAGAARPSTARPGTARPGTAQTGNARPGTARPSTAQSGASRSGTALPDVIRPGTAKPSMTRGDRIDFGTELPGEAQFAVKVPSITQHKMETVTPVATVSTVSTANQLPRAQTTGPPANRLPAINLSADINPRAGIPTADSMAHNITVTRTEYSGKEYNLAPPGVVGTHSAEVTLKSRTSRKLAEGPVKFDGEMMGSNDGAAEIHHVKSIKPANTEADVTVEGASRTLQIQSNDQSEAASEGQDRHRKKKKKSYQNELPPLAGAAFPKSLPPIRALGGNQQQSVERSLLPALDESLDEYLKDDSQITTRPSRGNKDEKHDLFRSGLPPSEGTKKKQSENSTAVSNEAYSSTGDDPDIGDDW